MSEILLEELAARRARLRELLRIIRREVDKEIAASAVPSKTSRCTPARRSTQAD